MANKKTENIEETEEKTEKKKSGRYDGRKNLLPVQSKEEAKERGRKGGLKSGEVRRAKRSMRELSKYILNSSVSHKLENVRTSLKNMGIEETEMTYNAAVVVRLLQKAMGDGDTSAIRLLAQMTGEIDSFGNPITEALEVVDMEYPSLQIPQNGRDEVKKRIIGPQAGPQTMFMTSSADIIIYGGAAGGGKTYALLLEALRHKDVKNFGGVILRKNCTQITAEGGLWDASLKLYSQVPDAEQRKSPKLHWIFNNGLGGKLTFAHLDREEDLNAWQGTEIAYLAFDELTHFSKHQFLYMLSRNRSTCGVRPYVRATCNPNSDSWVADFVSWWIDQDTGYPVKERNGIIRYMCTLNNVIYWADTPEELAEEHGISPSDCKSVTFIASKLEDNKILMQSDPAYLANLKAMAEVDMERLLYGNWKIKAQAGRYFKRTQIPSEGYYHSLPDDVVYWCRAWDIAATDEDENGDADYTSGVLIGRRKNGRYIIVDVINQQIKAGDVENLIIITAKADKKKYGYNYKIRIPQDPGAAGKIVAKQYLNSLAGFDVKAEPVSGSKELRATPLAAQWQNGFVDVLIAPWNEEYFSQLEMFPESKHDDMVDASADAFNELANGTFDIDSLL